jgi:hypothetical protein
MPSPFVRLAPPSLLIGDTGALMGEVVQSTRRGYLTSLMVALYHDSVRLFIARHVLDEVERDLPGYAAGLRVDPKLAMTRWNARTSGRCFSMI